MGDLQRTADFDRTTHALDRRPDKQEGEAEGFNTTAPLLSRPWHLMLRGAGTLTGMRCAFTASRGMLRVLTLVGRGSGRLEPISAVVGEPSPRPGRRHGRPA